MKQMTRTTLLAIMVCLTFSGLHAQTVQLKQVWKRNLSGSSGDEIMNEMAVHPDGTVIVAGRYTGGSVDVGGLTLTTPSYSDGFLVQYSPTGTPQWATKYNYNNNETFFGVTYAPGKIPLAVGGANTGFSNYSYANLAVATTTTTGVLSASLSNNGTGVNNYFCVTTDEAGKLYAGGWYMQGNSQLIDINFGRSPAATLFGSGTQDGIITKYDANRNVQWTRKIGGTGSDQVKKMVVANGYIYAVGTFQGTVDFDPSSSTFNLTAPTGVDNGFLLKWDTAGNFVNAWMISSVSSCGFSDIVLNGAGHLFLSAYASGGVVDINMGAAVVTVGSSGMDDAFLLKVDTGASYIWHRQFGGLGFERIQRLALNKNSDVYLAGYFSSSTLNMGYPNSLNLVNASTSLSTYDGFIAGYDSSGNSLCAYRYGSSGGNEHMMAIAFDTTNNLYVSGYYNGSLETEVTPGYSSLSTAVAGYDGFVLKYNTVCPYMDKALPFDQVTCSGKTLSLSTSIFGNNLSYQWKLNGVSVNNGTKYSGADTAVLTITNIQYGDTGAYVLEVSRVGCIPLITDSVLVRINSGVLSVAPTLFYRYEGNLLEENGGSAVVVGGNSFGSDRFGNASRAFNQVNSSYFQNVPDITSVNYTVSMWVSISGTVPQTLIWGGTSIRELQYSGGKLGMYNGSQFVDFGYAIAQNTWYHIGYIKEGSRCKLYINGAKVYDNPTLLAAGATNVSTILGSNGTDGMIGKGDELRIYNTSLSDEEMQTLYLIPQQFSADKQLAKCSGGTTVIKTKINGAQSYQWYKDGLALTNNSLYSGVTTDSLVISGAQPTEGGKYVLQATNECVIFNSDTTSLFIGTAQLTQNMLAKFYFNGTITDATGNLTATGTINYQFLNRFANNAQSASFLGASGRTSISFSPIVYDTLSISLWYYATSVSGVNRTLLSSNTSNARHLAINTANKLGYTNTNGTFVPTSTTIAASTWYHIVVTKMGNNQKIYVNGQLVINDNNAFLNSIVANALTRIGGSSGALEPAYGYIDDVLIYNRELNQLEVNGLYKNFETKTNPSPVNACNGIDNVYLTASFEEGDTTKYSLQWKKNGVAVSNGLKYTGANALTLWVYAAEHADTGLYTLEAIPNGFECLPVETAPARLSIAPSNQLTDSLRLHLRFSNSTADAGKLNQVIYNATAITYGSDRNGAANATAVFNGSTSKVVTAGSLASASRSFTVMAWFKANQSTGGIVSTANQYSVNATDYHSWLFIGTDNKLRGKSYNGNATTMASTADVNDNQWHHAALVVTPVAQFLYLDGVQVGTQPTTTASVPSSYVIVGNMYGGWPNTLAGWNNFFQGSIDDVKIYNRSLSENEISRSALRMGFGFSSNLTIGYCTGSSGVIASQAVGTGITYQWYKDGIALNNTAQLTGADSSSLNFVTFVPADSGNYQCAITRNCYTVLSDTIKVGVYSNIVVSTQPQSGNVCPGSTMVLSVKAKGAGLQYQWRKNGMNLTNGSAISGALSDTLRITSASLADAATYSVALSDSCSNYLISDSAIITVNAFPYAGATTTKVVYPMDGSITAIPSLYNATSVNLVSGTNRFNISSGALNFTRSTQSRMILPTNLFAAGNPHFTVSIWFKTSTTTTSMGLIGTASNNPTANPTVGWSPILYINNAGKLSGKFYDVNGAPYESSNSVTDGNWHQALLTGNGSSQSLYLDGVLVNTNIGTYSTTSTPYTIIGASYSASNGWSGHANGWQYFNGTLDDARIYTTYMTASEVMAQYQKPELTTQPQSSLLVCAGTTNQSISCAANGTNLLYQWYKNGIPLSNDANTSGVATNTITLSNVQSIDTGYYYARILNGCNYITTDSSHLLLNPIPVITSSPSSQSSCEGGSVSLAVSSTGSALFYQWQKDGVNLVNGANIAGATASVLTISTLTHADTADYRCIVSNTCGVDTSEQARVSLGATLQILQQPISQDICIGSTVTVFVKTNDPSATFTWQRNNTAVGYPNNDSLRFEPFNLSNQADYRVIVNSVCGVDTSDVATLIALSPPSITAQPRSVVGLCGNASINLSVTAIGSGLTYQWQKDGVDIPNATNALYTNNNPLASDTGVYQVVVTGLCGSPVTSTTSRVSYSQPVAITAQPINSLTICSGNNSYVNLNIAATGTILGYQWLKNGVPISNQSNVTGANSPNLQFLNSVLGAGNYSCRVYGACDTVTSNATVFSYYGFPTINSTLEPKSICEGGNVSFNISASNATQYRWYINGSWINDFPGKVQGATTDSVTAFNLTSADIGGQSASVYVWVSNGCQFQEVISNTTLLTLTSSISIVDQTDTIHPVCANQPTFIFVQSSSEADYVWKKDGVILSNQTNDTLFLSAVTSADNGMYTCEVNSLCGNATSLPVRLDVQQLVVPVITQTNNVLSTGSFNGYQWYKDGIAIEDATQQSYTPDAAGMYKVRVVNTSGCLVFSEEYNFTFTGEFEVSGIHKMIKMYPNPVHSDLFMEWKDLLLKEEVSVFDFTGKHLATVSISGGKLDVNQLPAGMYMLKFTTEDNQTGFIKFTKL